jgi:hypothetical protein
MMMQWMSVVPSRPFAVKRSGRFRVSVDDQLRLDQSLGADWTMWILRGSTAFARKAASFAEPGDQMKGPQNESACEPSLVRKTGSPPPAGSMARLPLRMTARHAPSGGTSLAEPDGRKRRTSLLFRD